MTVREMVMAAAGNSGSFISIAYRPSSTPIAENFIVPEGVTSLSILCVGAGGDGKTANSATEGTGTGGGGGGALAYSNNIAVTPGETLYVEAPDMSNGRLSGGYAAVTRVSNNTILVKAAGGNGGQNTGSATGGTTANSVGTVKYAGGNGAAGSTSFPRGGGGGGCATTAGEGANGAVAGTSEHGGALGAYIIVNGNVDGYISMAASSESTTDDGKSATAANIGAGGGGAANGTVNGPYGSGGSGGPGIVVIIGNGRTFSSGASF